MSNAKHPPIDHQPAPRIPKYCLHKPSGQGYCTLNGKQVYLGPYADPATQIAYNRAIAEWLAAGRRPAVPKDELTVTELCAAFIEYAKRCYSENGKLSPHGEVLRSIALKLEALYGTLPAQQFGPVQLKTIRAAWVKEKVTRGVVNRYTRYIVRVFKHAVENDMIGAQVCGALQMVEPLRRGRSEARESTPITPVEDARIDAVLPLVSRQVAAILNLMRLTGMRPGEACIMRPCDIDRSSSDIWVYRPASHKTQHHGKDREIFLGPRGQEVLRPFMLRPADSYMFSAVEAERERYAACETHRRPNQKPSARKTPRILSERYDTGAVNRCVNRAAKKVGIDTFSINRIRHSVGTRIRREFGLEAAQVALGHSQANITQVYAERDRTLAAKVAAEIG